MSTIPTTLVGIALCIGAIPLITKVTTSVQKVRDLRNRGMVNELLLIPELYHIKKAPEGAMDTRGVLRCHGSAAF